MTDDKMALVELLEKGADAGLIGDMLAFASERVMDAEVEVEAGARLLPRHDGSDRRRY